MFVLGVVTGLKKFELKLLRTVHLGLNSRFALPTFCLADNALNSRVLLACYEFGLHLRLNIANFVLSALSFGAAVWVALILLRPEIN